MKVTVLIVLLILHSSCSSESEDARNDVEDMPSFAADGGSDLSIDKLVDQGNSDDGFSNDSFKDMGKDLGQDLDASPLTDLTDASTSESDLEDMESTKIYRNFRSDERKSCSDVCKAQGLICDGKYPNSLFGQIAGIIQYSGDLSSTIISCSDIPEAERMSAIAGPVTFVSVECYCV